VQCQEGGQWVGLDVLLPDSKPSQPVATAQETFDLSSAEQQVAFDAAHCQQVQIQFVIEQRKDGTATERVVLSHMLQPARLIGKNITLRFAPSKWPKELKLEHEPAPLERIKAIAHEVGLDAVTSPTRTSPIKGSSAFKRMLGETLRVAAGRLFGYARLDRHRSVVKLVPGLATL